MIFFLTKKKRLKKKKKKKNNIKLSKPIIKKKSFLSKITDSLVGKENVDEAYLDELEEKLISADLGLDTSVKIIKNLEKLLEENKLSKNEVNHQFKQEIKDILLKNNSINSEMIDTKSFPKVILVVGVNGVGKTTTIAKLAYKFKKKGQKIILGAADTFRAAAVDQIQKWGERIGCKVISHGMNTDPGSVAYDTVKTAVDEKANVVIIDTAGRLHNKVGLMNELSKIKKVIQKIIPDAPHEVLLVIDGTTGQNAFNQTEEFSNSVDVTGICITKLDGTASGGVVIGISDKFDLPIKYIGIGEGIDDLKVFDTHDFIENIF